MVDRAAGAIGRVARTCHDSSMKTARLLIVDGNPAGDALYRQALSEVGRRRSGLRAADRGGARGGWKSNRLIY